MNSEIHSQIPEIKKSDEKESQNRFDPDKRIDRSESNQPEHAKDGFNPDQRIQASFRDDKGNVYQDENGLLKNKTYELNHYIFTTDSKGRIKSAEGTLRLKRPDENREPEKVSIKVISKNENLKTDDRGRLIGDRFYGPGTLGNLVAMDFHLNRGEYKKMENNNAKAVNEGKKVYLKVEPKYRGKENRPYVINATSTIDGEKITISFKNRSDV